MNELNEEKMIFVFGSNLAGRHGKGAALIAAQKYGAIYGKGTGLQGRSYGIATKDKRLFILNLTHIRRNIDNFIEVANDWLTSKPDWWFKVTQIGCGHAKFNPEDIAPLFAPAPANCYFDEAWKLWLPNRGFWGTYSEMTPMVRRVMDDEEYE